MAPTPICQVAIALSKNRAWSRKQLQSKVDLSRQTINKFFSGKPIDRNNFVLICQMLELDWQEIAGLQPEPILQDSSSQDNSSQDNSSQNSSSQNSDKLNPLVERVRQQLHDSIQSQCGTMRVLDMSQPIELSDLYTRVNILEKITGRQRMALAELLQRYHRLTFDERFSFSGIREERVPGLEAVAHHSKLMVLGKPGAGKTTFLKQLAVLCNQGKFQGQQLPFFFTLKAFAEAPGEPSLLDYLADELRCYQVENATAATRTIPNAGRGLVLLDGLDEVQDRDISRVVQELQQFARQFHRNQFAITCRIAAREYTFQQFTDVEIADFDAEQIAEFVNKWFQIKGDEIKATAFLEKLQDNPPIQELASNPLLLTLLCLVFEDAADFPGKRSELYEDGLNVLLKKWDGSRNIERDQVYRKLSLKGKVALLSRLACDRFQRGEYFFKQKQVEQQIAAYIEHLPQAATDPEVLQLDSEAVLKSIEAQHGLLVERARGLYSFSHLTFHEYFTALQIASPAPGIEQRLQSLVEQVNEPRWREVFFLVTELLEPADLLLQYMKQHIDTMLAADETLQQFLIWVQQKSTTVDAPYKPAAVRAFYFWLACDHDLARDLARDLDPDLKQALTGLRAQLPDPTTDWDEFEQWWFTCGKTWMEQLRQAMVTYRNIGHDWQFSEAQVAQLNQYVAANQLLVDCLNCECYVTRSVRQEIEATLLLPIDTKQPP